MDFRSDTVTKPTPGMLQAMTTAPLGDDVYLEDPTVNALQEKVARLCGKEAGLFVCSGTMGNQIAMRVHLNALEEAILDHRAHIYRWECGGVGYHSGASILPLQPEPGKNYITAEQIERSIHHKNNWHTPITKVIALENTLHGSVFPIEEIKKISEVAKKYNLIMHLDGARIWNACVATGLSLADYGQYFDSMSLCLSKGMGCPIGTVIVGTEEFIAKARHFRKLFGGGWRQAGILAAAGIYAIDNHWPHRMHEDHKNARTLADGLRSIGFGIDNVVETNMVFVDSSALGITFEEIAVRLARVNAAIRISPAGYKCRMVTHLDVSAESIAQFLEIMGALVKEWKKETAAAAPPTPNGDALANSNNNNNNNSNSAADAAYPAAQ